MTKERMEEIGRWFPKITMGGAVSISGEMVHECLDTIKQLQAEKDRLVHEVYRLHSMMNGTKAETSPPLDGEAQP
jgi:hypothetical protein